MKKIPYIVITLMVLIIVFTDWSHHALQFSLLYPFYRHILEGRALNLYNQFNYVCHKGNITCKSVLDFGCGFGGLSEMLYRGNKHIVSVDKTDHYIYKDKAHLLIIENTGDLPFSNLEFDVAVSTHVFHHIPKDHHHVYLKEMLRVAKLVTLIEEHPRNNMLCRFVNSEVLTHANAHMTIDEWIQHISKMNLQVKHYKLNKNEYAFVIS